jgi:hypothetical protein
MRPVLLSVSQWFEGVAPPPQALCRPTSPTVSTKVGRQVNPKHRLALAAATALVAASLSPAAAQAAVRPATTCYQFQYSNTINSYEIQVSAIWECPGEQEPQIYLLLEKDVNGTYTYVTTNDVPTYSTTLTYICNTSAHNSWAVLPEFTGGSTYSTYYFTDACG